MADPTKTKTLQLNPADVTIDDRLPPYPTISTDLLMTKPSDEDVTAGKPLRLAARQKVVKALDKMVADQRSMKTSIQEKWENLNDKQRSSQQDILNIYKNPIYLDLFNYLKTELVWWNNNVELSPRQVNARDLKYDEIISVKQKILDNLIKDNLSAEERKEMLLNKKEEERRQALRSRTTYDDLSDSFLTLGKILFWLIYIAVGLRCGSLAANGYLYKPVPYRILAFVYVFFLAPFFGPYYLWKAVENYIWKTPLPPYEGFFPLFPYDPSEPLTLNRRFTGYMDSPQLREWIGAKIAEESAARDAAVVSKGLRGQIIAEHSV